MDRIPFAFEIVTQPTVEPLSLDEAKSQCRLDGVTDYDQDLTWLIQVAREKVESDSERAFMNQTRRIWLDQFPNAGNRGRNLMNPFPSQPWLYGGAMQAMEIPIKPVTSITSILYFNQSGVWATMDPAIYIADLVTYPVRITPTYGLIWPICRVQINSVQVLFQCGAASAAAVPAMARHAMRLLVGHWFENREAVGQVGDKIKLGYDSLIDGIRWH